MHSELPLQSELKSTRCAAWKRETDRRFTPIMSELANSIIALLGKGDPMKLAKQLASYRKSEPSFPGLEVCVAVESVLERAKGQIYQAITRTERELHQELQKRFGELPLQYDPENKTYYGNTVPPPPVEIGEIMTLVQFTHILNVRNIIATELAKAIGSDNISWQRIAKLRGEGAKGNQSPLPPDISADIIGGLKKLEAGREPAGEQAATAPTAPPPAERRELQIAGDDLRIVGLGGLDISVPAQLNLQDFRLEDGSGNVLIQDRTLRIPPIPLTDQQRGLIRRWIAETVAKKMV